MASSQPLVFGGKDTIMGRGAMKENIVVYGKRDVITILSMAIWK